MENTTEIQLEVKTLGDWEQVGTMLLRKNDATLNLTQSTEKVFVSAPEGTQFPDGAIVTNGKKTVGNGHKTKAGMVINIQECLPGSYEIKFQDYQGKSAQLTKKTQLSEQAQAREDKYQREYPYPVQLIPGNTGYWRTAGRMKIDRGDLILSVNPTYLEDLIAQGGLINFPEGERMSRGGWIIAESDQGLGEGIEQVRVGFASPSQKGNLRLSFFETFNHNIVPIAQEKGGFYIQIMTEKEWHDWKERQKEKTNYLNNIYNEFGGEK